MNEWGLVQELVIEDLLILKGKESVKRGEDWCLKECNMLTNGELATNWVIISVTFLCSRVSHRCCFLVVGENLSELPIISI